MDFGNFAAAILREFQEAAPEDRDYLMQHFPEIYHLLTLADAYAKLGMGAKRD